MLVFDPTVNTYAELANFLGVEPPCGKDFPHVNSKVEFQNLKTALTAAAGLIVAMPLLILGAVVHRF